MNEVNVTWTQLEREITHLRELMVEHNKANDKALVLATEEIQRRLEALNGAHREIIDNWTRSLPRETFAVFEREVLKWREEAVGWREKVTGELSGIRTTIDEKGREIDRAATLRADLNRKLIAMVGIGVTIFSTVVSAGLWVLSHYLSSPRGTIP